MFEEKIIVGENTKHPLNGILTLPDEINNPLPALVLVHGSGPSNMDEKVGKLTPFKDLAEGLASRGIATIRYDKRTYAHKRQFINKPDTTVKEETIEDAVLATELLRKDPRIDSNKIFILGHSMGGMLAPRIDAEGGKYKGLILLAGTPRKLEEVLIEQSKDVLTQVNKLLQWIIKRQIKKLSAKFDTMYNLSDEKAKKTSLMFGSAIKLYYFKEMGEHNSVNYLKDLDKPMLIMQGDKDFQVSVEKDFNLYKELLKNKDKVTFKLYENLNHAFVPSVYGNIKNAKKEYNVRQSICDYVMDDIANWVLSN